MPERKDLMAREIAHAAGRFIACESNVKAMITVTRADVSPDFSNTIIYVSVLPEESEKEAMDFLRRARSDFREWVAKELRFKRVPMFDFHIDVGEKNRQQVQNL